MVQLLTTTRVANHKALPKKKRKNAKKNALNRNKRKRQKKSDLPKSRRTKMMSLTTTEMERSLSTS